MLIENALGFLTAGYIRIEQEPPVDAVRRHQESLGRRFEIIASYEQSIGSVDARRSEEYRRMIGELELQIEQIRHNGIWAKRYFRIGNINIPFWSTMLD